MQNAIIDLDWDELTFLSMSGKTEELLSTLRKVVDETGFERTSENDWTYRRVASFLEDGWTACSGYVHTLPSEPINKTELGRIINHLVGGCRYDREHAELAGAKWVFTENRADAAALVFYCGTVSPDEVKEVLEQAS